MKRGAQHGRHIHDHAAGNAGYFLCSYFRLDDLAAIIAARPERDAQKLTAFLDDP